MARAERVPAAQKGVDGRWIWTEIYESKCRVRGLAMLDSMLWQCLFSRLYIFLLFLLLYILLLFHILVFMRREDVLFYINDVSICTIVWNFIKFCQEGSLSNFTRNHCYNSFKCVYSFKFYWCCRSLYQTSCYQLFLKYEYKLK